MGTVPGLDAPLTTPPPGLLSVVHIAVWVMCGVCVVMGSVLVAAMVGQHHHRADVGHQPAGAEAVPAPVPLGGVLLCFVLVGGASALVGVVV